MRTSAQAGAVVRTTLESVGSRARGSALLLEAAPPRPNHRAVADAYMRLGILDVAHEHLSAAVKLEPRDAASWDGSRASGATGDSRISA